MAEMGTSPRSVQKQLDQGENAGFECQFKSLNLHASPLFVLKGPICRISATIGLTDSITSFCTCSPSPAYARRCSNSKAAIMLLFEARDQRYGLRSNLQTPG